MNEEKIDVNGLDEDLVVLTTDDGVEHNFYHVATVDYKNEWYVFFQPAECLQHFFRNTFLIHIN